MKATWVVVADSSRARIFKPETPSSPLTELETLTHPESRLHDQELTSDLPGKHANDTGIGAHGFEDKTEPKKQEAINFAHELARELEKAYTDHEFRQLILVAAPAFLGLLRETLSEPVRAVVRLEIDKDLTKESAEDIRAHLPKYLPNL